MRDTDSPRTVVVAPAWFAHYRPRRGLADTLDALADVPDTMLEMYLPAPFAASLRWKEGKVDGSATISGWLSGRGRLVSFACYMGELEADIFCDGGKQCSCFSQGEQAAGSARRAKNSHGLERRGAGMESEEEMRRVRDLGGYLMESTNRSLMERQLAERLRRAWKGFVGP